MKKLMIGLVACVMILSFSSVNAKEVYVNSNGVSIDRNIYEKLCSIYTESYVDVIDAKELQKILSNDLENVVVKEIKDFDNLYVSKSSSHQTANKSLTMVKDNSSITLIVNWFNVPNTKTYDVIGVMFGSGISRKGNVTFKQSYDDNTGKKIISTTHYDKFFSNGFGSSFKVGNGTNYMISISFDYSGSGTIYGSYQHAKKSTTLAESQKYTLSSSGYGGVFAFDSSVKDKFDAMGGVDIKV